MTKYKLNKPIIKKYFSFFDVTDEYGDPDLEIGDKDTNYRVVCNFNGAELGLIFRFERTKPFILQLDHIGSIDNIYSHHLDEISEFLKTLNKKKINKKIRRIK